MSKLLFSANDTLLSKLKQRQEEDALRELKVYPEGIDFFSNDYLGLAKKSIDVSKENISSAGTGSRLISGNFSSTEHLEKKIATFHKSEHALLFSSGYLANLGLLSCIAGRNDTILYDELCHASLRDGIRLSQGKSFSFLHNDYKDLEKKIQQSSGRIFVVMESVYSMDGDELDWEILKQLVQRYELNLIIDEAHAVGIYGERGEGKVVEHQAEEWVLARIVTYGKAFAYHGAAVLGSELLRTYLINYCRPFIYTTALSPYEVECINKRYDEIAVANMQRDKLEEVINYFHAAIANNHSKFLSSKTAIQAFVLPDNKKIKQLADKLNQQKILVRAILSPTVPKGKERIRIVLHAYNTQEEIDNLINGLIHA